ncbi:hypothetical protein CH298_26705 [Rhodococcoides fascians]|nr:hypothetical protein CH303_27245 [Rhodococcus fascians]OZF10186.1 hypothetical protein CH298_26705 [Rhodococcus fascians]OZF59374.1 hypothetical protein CH308_27445 [Rhodococcus fascians]
MEIGEPLISRFFARLQGGGRAPAVDRAVFTAIVCAVNTGGCEWRRRCRLRSRVTVPTALRRFTAWVAAGAFEKSRREELDQFGGAGERDWTAMILDAANVRALGESELKIRA